jgi:hypothetical protein
MLRRTRSSFIRYTLRRHMVKLVRKAIGFAIVIGGFAVIAMHLLGRK